MDRPNTINIHSGSPPPRPTQTSRPYYARTPNGHGIPHAPYSARNHHQPFDPLLASAIAWKSRRSVIPHGEVAAPWYYSHE